MNPQLDSAPMNTFPLHPSEAVRIGSSCFSFAAPDGKLVYFSNLEPFDFHDECDRRAILLLTAKLTEN